jgi:hypothetical protein
MVVVLAMDVHVYTTVDTRYAETNDPHTVLHAPYVKIHEDISKFDFSKAVRA